MVSHTAQMTGRAYPSSKAVRKADTLSSPNTRRQAPARGPSAMGQRGRRVAGGSEPGKGRSNDLPRLPRVTARAVVDGRLTTLPEASWPACLKRRYDGHLQVGALRLSELAEIVGTPFILGDPPRDEAPRRGDAYGDHDPLHPVLVMSESSPVDAPAPRNALRDGNLLLIPLPTMRQSTGLSG